MNETERESSLPSLDIAKLKLLLRFYETEAEAPTVTGIARETGEAKYTISRTIRALAEDGLLDNGDSRHIVLTEKGAETAAMYDARVKMDAAHLMYEGVDAVDAKRDALGMALYCSEATHRAIRATDSIYRAKLKFRGRKKVSGKELFAALEEGTFHVPFVIYRDHPERGRILSMANDGFQQPCELRVRDGHGNLTLHAREMTEKSGRDGTLMQGTLSELSFMAGRKYIRAENVSDNYIIPADGISFRNIGSGTGQILHGTIRLKMKCSVGVVHMPESVAVFTMIL